MKLTCPKCKAPIPAEDVNVVTDLARCVRCDEVFKPSERLAVEIPPEDLELPAGSRITFEEAADGGATFVLPRKGLRGGDVFTFVFASIWIGFVAFWTLMAGTASILFAAFSIPFWVVGVFLWRGLLIGITERQTIEIGREALTIARKSVLSSKRQVIPYTEIRSISTQAFLPRDPFTAARHMRGFQSASSMHFGIRLPTIEHGTKKTRFAESVSEAEMKWMVGMLNVIVMGKGA